MPPVLPQELLNFHQLHVSLDVTVHAGHGLATSRDGGGWADYPMGIMGTFGPKRGEEKKNLF